MAFLMLSECKRTKTHTKIYRGLIYKTRILSSYRNEPVNILLVTRRKYMIETLQLFIKTMSYKLSK